jgi:hypothetical protein
VRVGTRAVTGGIQLRRVEAPLFARVVAEELFIQLAAHFVDHDIFRCANLLFLFRDRLEELLDLERCQAQAIHLVDRVEVDRNGQQLPVDAGEYSVLILTPLRETRQILEDVLRVGVEDVRPVTVNQNAGVVVVIVGIARDVRTAINDEHFLVRVARQTFGQHTSCVTRTNDEKIKHMSTRGQSFPF